jgi:amino acid transporter
MSFTEWLNYIWLGYQSVIGAIIVFVMVVVTLGVIVFILSMIDNKTDDWLAMADPELREEFLKIKGMQLEALRQEKLFMELHKQEENRLQTMYSEWNW